MSAEDAFQDFCALRGIDEDDAAWLLFEDWLGQPADSPFDTLDERNGLR